MIDEALPALCAALAAHRGVVLEAPPGAGKTTRVPLALLDAAVAPWLGARRIVMLEPRRLAARAAATYMASRLGEGVGEQVGYRIRGDTRVSRRTRIEVITEGVLARLLSSDASLDDYGLVIFDEFHERSLHADLGLALTLETQTHLRDDLRILLMSATLDGDAAAALVGTPETPAPVVRSAGRAFPVETFHRPPRTGEYLDAAVARTVREAVAAHEGDVLVFLPGALEQRRVGARLANDDVLTAHRVVVHTLHGAMPLAAQDAALAAAPRGERKVVLATAVAETSLTIEGVRVVVDSGLSRLPRYDARLGLTRLDTVRVSRASADQRRGRAGRVAAGACYRVWDAHEEHGFQLRTRPEILEADLASLALELAEAGVHDPATLRWMDVPRAGAFSAARELLAQLGALDASGRITPHGRRMAALPLQPRLAHLLLVATDRGEGDLGAELAALLEERDLVRGGRDADADMVLRVDLLRGQGSAMHRASVSHDDVARVRHAASELARRAGVPRGPRETRDARATSVTETGALLALAFPDRVAMRRDGAEPRYLLRSGAGAALPKHDALASSPWLAVAELDGSPPEHRIVRAAALTLAEVESTFGADLVRETSIAWHEPTSAVRAVRRTRLGAITLEESVVRDPDAAAVWSALRGAIVGRGIAALPWSAAAAALRARLAFLHHHDASWPDVSDDALTTSLDVWLMPVATGMRRWADLLAVPWHDALLGLLPWDRRAPLDRLAPSHLDVPSGSRIALDYREPDAPVLAVKLQEVFGWTATPTLLGGQVPVTLHLLSPAQRPVQVTRDLAGFWRSSYFEVRKELRGRYPRHPWPDDPLTAPATRRAKPRG